MTSSPPSSLPPWGRGSRYPPLQPYRSWFYHNVSGMTWKLYLTRRLNIPVMSWFWPRIVVEVYQYPTNSVIGHSVTKLKSSPGRHGE
jgi:hypothetical protein